jgi:phospholipase C
MLRQAFVLPAVIVLLASSWADGTPESMRQVKEELSNIMTPAELLHRFGRVEPMGATPPHQSKIDHFVILFMENRAFDHLFGKNLALTVSKRPAMSHAGLIVFAGEQAATISLASMASSTTRCRWTRTTPPRVSSMSRVERPSWSVTQAPL